jgi:two-component system chemotaxis response regulator CheB
MRSRRVVGKPMSLGAFAQMGPQLVERIKASVGAKLRPAQAATLTPTGRGAFAHSLDPRHVILLGASTGGTEALREVLTALPGGLPGIAIVQHLPPVFSKAFADRLGKQCNFQVREAVDGDRLEATTRCGWRTARPSGTSAPRSTSSSSPPPTAARRPTPWRAS